LLTALFLICPPPEKRRLPGRLLSYNRGFFISSMAVLYLHPGVLSSYIPVIGIVFFFLTQRPLFLIFRIVLTDGLAHRQVLVFLTYESGALVKKTGFSPGSCPPNSLTSSAHNITCPPPPHFCISAWADSIMMRTLSGPNYYLFLVYHQIFFCPSNPISVGINNPFQKGVCAWGGGLCWGGRFATSPQKRFVDARWRLQSRLN